MPKNVLGTALTACCHQPKTGFYRDGFCRTGPQDISRHTVCAIMTAEFLSYSKTQGNDLTTPIPLYQFPGLKPGDKWCLCASRWKQAAQAGVAPPILLEATHEKTLEIVNFDLLLDHKH